MTARLSKLNNRINFTHMLALLSYLTACLAQSHRSSDGESGAHLIASTQRLEFFANQTKLYRFTIESYPIINELLK